MPDLSFNIVLAAQSAQLSAMVIAMIVIIIAVALVFDFLNGFHDAANSIATIVATRVLTPRQAVMWAAFWNFIAAFFFGTKVAQTIGEKLVDPTMVDLTVVWAGLMGAIVWNIITWWRGLPTSSSHALMSGLAGAAIAKAGVGVIIWKGWMWILVGLIMSPVLGLIFGSLSMILVSWIFRRSSPQRVDGLFRKLQLLSAAVYSLAHGGNDAQKTMGVIAILLTTVGLQQWIGWGQVHMPWVHHSLGMPIILACHAAIALGTMFGGWRIVKTMGTSITKLQPVGGCCAESAAAMTIIGATIFKGVPISTTHAITGSILGVGVTRGIHTVRWIWGQRIVMAWILTIPCSAFIAAMCYVVGHQVVVWVNR